jgi:hypothetical protein
MGVEFERLAKGHPDRGREILRGCRHPKREHVDAAVGLAVVAQRPGNPSGGVFGVPRFHPRANAFFESLDDLRGDARVNVLTVCIRCFLHFGFLHLKSSFFPKSLGMEAGVQSR